MAAKLKEMLSATCFRGLESTKLLLPGAKNRGYKDAYDHPETFSGPDQADPWPLLAVL